MVTQIGDQTLQNFLFLENPRFYDWNSILLFIITCSVWSESKGILEISQYVHMYMVAYFGNQ